jgi:hypothetical protein
MRAISGWKSKSKRLAAWMAFGGLFSLAEAQERTILIPLVLDGRTLIAKEWRINTVDPGADWTRSSFDDASWLTAYGGFGSGTVLGFHINTDWSTSDIWMRQSFTVSDPDFESLVLGFHHDDDLEVYLNGAVIFQQSGFTNDYGETNLGDDARALLKAGANEIAVHCHNNDGPGYVDVSLSGMRTMQPNYIISDARTFPEEWKYVNADPGSDWYQPSFADADWAASRSGFGSTEYSAYVNTAWIGTDIWLRKTFTLDKAFDDYYLASQHDDGMEIYVNGNLVVQEAGFTTEFKEQFPPSLKALLVVGVNTIAVHCSNNGSGPQFIDVSLVGLSKLVAVGLCPKPAEGRLKAGAVPRRFPRVLFAGRVSGLDLSVFPGSGAGSLGIYGLDGTFRHLWRTSSGSGQGLLINMP